MTNLHEFYITYIRCDTPIVETQELSIREQYIPLSVSEYQDRIDSKIPEKRIVVLSIWNALTIDEMYKAGVPLPNEVYTYLNGFDDYPEPPDSCQFNDDNDFEDGDDWKRLLN